ncbi:MAG: isopentenyl-diphosphate delta-isomerase, partial [Anaerolineales bacterium]|nr:isopentenyl-diphosphate delta-isomerase [Anaerolineales bacterium]
MSSTQDDLKRILSRIDGRSYPAYKDIAGAYEFPQFTLIIDHVQGDPFASPSRVRVRVPQTVAQFPPSLFSNKSRRVGLEGYLAAAFEQACRKAAGRSGSGKSGLMEIDGPGQEVLEQTAVSVTPKYVEARFRVGLPARGRTVLGYAATDMLCEALPQMVQAALLYKNRKPAAVQRYVETNEDADALRAQLAERGLVAFVADGAILPRRSGVDERPLQGNNVIAFQSPASLRVSFTLPNRGEVSGMGIPAGVTLIVGGGFHGKSTL